MFNKNIFCFCVMQQENEKQRESKPVGRLKGPIVGFTKSFANFSIDFAIRSTTLEENIMFQYEMG